MSISLHNLHLYGKIIKSKLEYAKMQEGKLQAKYVKQCTPLFADGQKNQNGTAGALRTGTAGQGGHYSWHSTDALY